MFITRASSWLIDWIIRSFRRLIQSFHRLRTITVFKSQAKLASNSRDTGGFISSMKIALALTNRFNETGEQQDLDNAILRFRQAFEDPPPDHVFHSNSLVLFAGALFERHSRQGDKSDRDEAILRLKEAIQLPSDDPDAWFTWLLMLTKELLLRFEQEGDKRDVDDTVSYAYQAAELAPVGRLNQFSLLSHVGIALRQRFLQHGDKQLLEEAILRFREAHRFPPPNPESHSTSLSYLAWLLLERFKCEDNRMDIDDAMVLSRRAAALGTSGRSEHFTLLNRAALSLRHRSSKRRDKQGLDDAILLYREALEDPPADHLRHSVSLFRHAAALLERFNHRHDNTDLDNAVLQFQEGLELQLIGFRNGSHPDADTFFLLIASLDERFDKDELADDAVLLLGRGAEFDDAIMLLRRSLELCPANHSHYPYVLHYLGNALSGRYGLSSKEQDLNEAINCLENAMRCIEDGHPSRPKLLRDLASNLLTRGKEMDVEIALQHSQEALTLFPVDHQYRTEILHSLMLSRLRSYMQTGERQAFREASTLQEQSLSQPDASDVFKKPVFENFMDLFKAFLRRLREGPDLPDDDPIFDVLLLNIQEVMESFDASALPGMSVPLKRIADVCCYRLDNIQRQDYRESEIPNSADRLRTAMQFFRDAAWHQLSSPLQCLEASVGWAHNAQKYQHDSELEAYARSLHLLDIHLSMTASISSRQQTRKSFPPYLAVNAASCAIRRGDCPRAIEFLEQGRTIIWNQLARYHMPIQDLLQGDDYSVELGKRLTILGSLLNNPPTGVDDLDNASMEAATRNYKILVEDWNRVVADVRKLEGFNNFLLPPQFSELREAAREGPAIVIVASLYSCDALIITTKEAPLHIPLQTSITDLALLVNRLQVVVRRTYNDAEQDKQLKDILQQLWGDVVSPVVAALEQVAKKRSRIWWCPTSLFAYLPLHAAGDYSRPDGRHLSQLYVSSYTPSLSALIRTRRGHQDMLKSKKFAVIGQAQPQDDLLPLQSVEEELHFMESIIQERVKNVRVTMVPSSMSTREAALHALGENGWVHFSCHGVQNYERPYDSCLRMQDESLSLYDTTQVDLRRHEFVFLSACETAVGEAHTPDEVIHLAAGLQFAGVKSVIGSMWEVEDATVHYLVKEFYKNMFADGEMDCTRAARALHKALRSPEVKKMPLAQRIVFIHIGI